MYIYISLFVLMSCLLFNVLIWLYCWNYWTLG